MGRAAGRRGFGFIRKLPSKRWQASYVGPDGVRYTGPSTFDTKADAEGWLARERALMSAETWASPNVRAAARRRTQSSFREFAESWLVERPLKPRTVEGYRHLLGKYLYPTFGDVAVGEITKAMVRTWWARRDKRYPTVNERAYVLLKGICNTAVEDELLSDNPCRIRLEKSSVSTREIRPATLGELEVIVEALPPRLRLLALLTAWCALRRGEVLELRRKDLDLRAGTLRIDRAVQWIANEVVIGTPKSAAGTRTVTIPPHLLPVVEAHVATFVPKDREALLFTGRDGTTRVTPTALQGAWSKARAAAGREDLRLHDLRHTGATMAAMAGATLAELQARLGHSSVNAALRYQHAVQGRDAQIAAAPSQMAEGGQPLRRAMRR